MLALGAYTKKTDADALVYNAMGEHAKQVEVTSFHLSLCIWQLRIGVEHQKLILKRTDFSHEHHFGQSDQGS